MSHGGSHVSSFHRAELYNIIFETDKLRFIKWSRTTSSPKPRSFQVSRKISSSLNQIVPAKPSHMRLPLRPLRFNTGIFSLYCEAPILIDLEMPKITKFRDRESENCAWQKVFFEW